MIHGDKLLGLRVLLAEFKDAIWMKVSAGAPTSAEVVLEVFRILVGK